MCPSLVSQASCLRLPLTWGHGSAVAQGCHKESIAPGQENTVYKTPSLEVQAFLFLTILQDRASGCEGCSGSHVRPLLMEPLSYLGNGLNFFTFCLGVLREVQVNNDYEDAPIPTQDHPSPPSLTICVTCFMTNDPLTLFLEASGPPDR